MSSSRMNRWLQRLGLWLARPGAAVRVLEANDVLQLRRGHLEDVAVFERHHAVLHPRADVVALARAHHFLHQAAPLVDDQEQLSALDVDRLVLALMKLQRELVALLHVKKLPDVAIGVSPDQLVPPRLLHPPRRHHVEAPTCFDHSLGATNAESWVSRLKSARYRCAASLLGKLPIRTRYQVPFPVTSA